jgi:hypothetical protein
MRQKPLVYLLVLMVATLGCSTNEAMLFEEESDDVFQGGVRKVVQPFEDKWVLYYFTSESAENMREKILGSEFFRNGGWTELKISKPNAFWGSRQRGANQSVSKGELVTISIVEGKLGPDLKTVESDAGCSVILTPAPQ